MNYEIAANILAEIKPARRKRERYRQRDEMQHRVIPLCLLMTETGSSEQ